MLDMYNAMILFGLLLIAGVVIRELVPPLQKVLLPASLIGGFLGLILGQQVLGIIEIPVAFTDITSIGMRIIMACVPIGVTVSAKRIYQHLDFTFTNMTAFGFQMIFGLLLGALFIKFWPDLPEGWGLMGVAAYHGSHGTVPVVSEVIDPEGMLGAQSIGMVMATIGILFAMIPGMIIANYGVRKGWATFTHDIANQPKYFFRGTLPEEKREALGKTTVNQISNFTLEMIILAACATIQLDVVSKLFAPLFLHALISMTVTGLFIFIWMKKIGHPQWFEKSLMLFGMCTGSNPQGLSLVRAVDPENKSCIYEALGVYNAVFFWNFILIPFAASVVLYNRIPIYILGVGLMSTVIIGMVLFSREKKAGNSV